VSGFVKPVGAIMKAARVEQGRGEVAIMPHPRYSSEEVGRVGKELYEKSIRARVETEENIGKIISIDIETGDYEIGDDLVQTARRLLAKNPNAAIWHERIGYDVVYAVGGTRNRTAR